MSTHSRITVRTSKGIRKTVYCHSDGYVDFNGVILFNSYSNIRKAKRLVRGGNISSLGSKVNPYTSPKNWFVTKLNKQGELEKIATTEPHSFSNRHYDITTYYKRDRDEEGQEPIVLKNSDSIGNKLTDAVESLEYNYYHDGTKWFVNGKCLKAVLIVKGLLKEGETKASSKYVN